MPLYESKLPAWSHQKEALKRLEGRKAYALLMEMRTGKTKVTLDDFGRLEAEGLVDDLLVVAPAGCYHTWKRAIDEHVGDALRERLKVHVWKSGGSNSRRSSALNEFLNAREGPRVFIVNVEALSTVDLARQSCLSFLRHREGRTMMAVDESTTIKSPTAKRAKYIVNVLGPIAEYRRILSGLPTPQGPLDLFMQFYFLDWNILGHSKFMFFKSRYAITRRADFGGRWPVDVVVGYRDVEELAKKIEPHSYRVRLEDCYELPPKMYQIRHVDATDEQRVVYDQIKKYACAKIETADNQTAHMVSTVVVAQLLRMHQVLCGRFVDENGVPHNLKENRTAELISLISEFNGKAIIWVSYDADVHRVTEALEKEFGEGCCSRFWGGNRTTREDEEKAFIADPDRRFMIATPAAGGRGRTWLVASLVVYYNNTDNLEHRSQSEERAQAVGKKDQVMYVDLMVQGTVEEKIISSLRGKIDMASVITRDNYKEWLI